MKRQLHTNRNSVRALGPSSAGRAGGAGTSERCMQHMSRTWRPAIAAARVKGGLGDAAIGEGTPVLITGSLFTVGAAMKTLGVRPDDAPAGIDPSRRAVEEAAG